jgi:hypothetical protein
MEPLQSLPLAVFSLGGLIGIYRKHPAGPALAGVGSSAWAAYALSRGEYPWAVVELCYAMGAFLTWAHWRASCSNS